MIAHGTWRKSGCVSLVRVKRWDKGHGIVGIRLLFVKCELDLKDTSMVDLDIEQTETQIVANCFLLPHVKSKND